MTNDELARVLLWCVRQIRSDAEIIDELGATLHGVRELVVGEHPELAERIQAYEDEAKSATRDIKQASMRETDDIIRKLEADRKPTVH